VRLIDDEPQSTPHVPVPRRIHRHLEQQWLVEDLSVETC
jgi:hypothetical protein